MVKEIRIGFVTATDPLDKRSWSGIHYRMFKTLQQEFGEILPLGPFRLPKRSEKLLFLIYKLNKLLFKKHYNITHNILTSKTYARILKKRLKSEEIDLLFAPAASTEIAYLKTDIPIVYLSDTSFDQIRNYYTVFSGMSGLSIKESDSIEKKAIEKSALQIYSSQWASNHVINHYHADPKQVFVVKFGANVDNPPGTNEVVKDYSGTIKLLFLGVDWERKGGDIALAAFKILQQRNYDVELVVCGCTPPETNSKMTVIKFLDKNTEADSKKFKQLLLETHLLFLPTRADCTPLAFGEANAYGIPVITTDTGGVSAIIEQGVNGYALPFESSAEVYADTIQELIDNREQLKEMSLTSRQKFDHELNWNVWGTQVKEIIVANLFKGEK